MLGARRVALGLGVAIRGERRFGGFAIVVGRFRVALAYLASLSGVGKLESVVVWSALFAAMLRFATPLIFASIGGMFSERSGVVNIGLEGMMLMGAFFAILGADKTDSWVARPRSIGVLAGGALALVHAFFAIHLRADQIVGGTAINFLALGITGYLFIDIYGAGRHADDDIRAIPDVHLGFLDGVPFLGPIFGQLNLMIWLALPARRRAPRRHVPDPDRAAHPRGRRAPARRGHRRHQRLPRSGTRRSSLSGMLAARGGAYLSIGFVNSFNENMTAGRGFIALAALIFGNWRPFGAAARACCSASRARSRSACPSTRSRRRCSSRRFRTCSR